MSSSNIEKTIEKIPAFIKTLVDEGKFSGVVLIADKKQIYFHKAYAYANKAFQVPNTPEVLFNIGSLNKMFTGVAIGQLVQKGKISFTTKLAEILTESNLPKANEITVHQLLTHTSGMVNFYTDEFVKESVNYLVLKDYLPLIEKEKLVFEPGTGVSYSNSAYIIAGLIIEEISEQSYFTYIKENIFKVADMNTIGFYRIDDCIENLAEGYTKENHTKDFLSPWRKFHFNHPVKGSSAGGAYSTAKDLYKFGVGLIEHKFLNKDYTKLVTTGKIQPPDGKALSKISYGFGETFINKIRNVGHSGGAPGCNASFRIIDDDIIVVVVSNYDPPSAHLVADEIRNLICNSH